MTATIQESMCGPFNVISRHATITVGYLLLPAWCFLLFIIIKSACMCGPGCQPEHSRLPSYLSHHYSLRSHMGFRGRLVCCILISASSPIKLVARSEPVYWQLCQPPPFFYWTDHCKDQWRDVAYRWKYSKFNTAQPQRFMNAAGVLSNMEPLFISVAC